jgi:hypothetical protein
LSNAAVSEVAANTRTWPEGFPDDVGFAEDVGVVFPDAAVPDDVLLHAASASGTTTAAASTPANTLPRRVGGANPPTALPCPW